MASLEVMEASAPLRFVRRELVPDSGGAGRFRGGLAQEIEVEVLGKHSVYVSTSSERIKNPPRGYQRGMSGSAAALFKNEGEYLAPKGRTLLRPGDTVTVRTPGGGGFGRPSARDPLAIASDRASGYVGASLAATARSKTKRAPPNSAANAVRGRGRARGDRR